MLHIKPRLVKLTREVEPLRTDPFPLESLFTGVDWRENPQGLLNC